MIRLLTSIKWPRSARVMASSFACVLTFSTMHVLAEPTPAEQGLAAALFEQARQLMSAGMIDEACSKFAESQRKDPGGGTLLNLALCHEKQGKIATAWTEFRQARSMAKRDNRPDREAAAEAEISKIEPQLFRVSVVVAPEAKVPGLTIEVDGLSLDEAAWGTPIPLDPGSRTIIAKAAGYREWKTVVEVRPTAGAADVPVPKLVKADATNVPPVPTGTATTSSTASNPPPPPKKPVDGEPQTPSSSMRTAGTALGGIGLGLIAVGSVAGGLAIYKNKQTDAACGNLKDALICSDPKAIDLNDTALAFAHTSTAAFGLGIVSGIVGLVLLSKAPGPPSSNISVNVGPQSLSITGKF